MFQLPVIIISTFAIFVGTVCPVLQSEGHNSNITDIPAHFNTLINNENGTVQQPVTEKEEVKLNKTKTEESPTNVKDGNDKAPVLTEKGIEQGKHICNSTNEQFDMTHCNVKPHDNDSIIEKNTNSTGPEILTKVVNNTTAPNNTKLDLPNDSSKNNTNNGKTVNKEEDIMIVSIHQKPHENGVSSTDPLVPYVTDSTQTEHTTNGTITDTDRKLNTDHTEVSISSVAPLLVDKDLSKESESISGSEKSTDEVHAKGMPPGVIILVIAIGFAIAIVVAYVGMITWRRYVEYRYGHRELLVNELEFDTNDLRHFEL